MKLLQWLRNWVTQNYGSDNVDCFDLEKLAKDLGKFLAEKKELKNV